MANTKRIAKCVVGVALALFFSLASLGWYGLISMLVSSTKSAMKLLDTPWRMYNAPNTSLNQQ